MRIIEDVFQMKGKECKDQERLKMCRRKSMSERGRCFCMGWATLSEPVAVDGRGLWQPREIQRRRKRRKINVTSQSTLLGRARTGMLWLCYARPLARTQKREISSCRRRPMTTPWEKDSWEVMRAERRGKNTSDRTQERAHRI